MFSAKTLVAATFVVGQAAAFSMPSCWSTCFDKYNIKSEGCLCSESVEKVVKECISTGCAASNSTGDAHQYKSWLSGYCGEQPSGPVIVTDITTQYTTICPVTATETSGTASAPTVYTTTSTLPTVYKTTVPATTWATVSTVVTETSTVVTPVTVGTTTWASTATVTTVWATTKVPGLNTWTGTNSVAPVTVTSTLAVNTPPAPSGVRPPMMMTTGVSPSGVAPSGTSAPSASAPSASASMKPTAPFAPVNAAPALAAGAYAGVAVFVAGLLL